MITLDKIKERAGLEGVSFNLILKEYTHFFVLDYFFKAGLFSHLVFQGGTALKLAYQGVRYSEDLDFVLTRKNSQFLNSLGKRIFALATYLDKLLPFARDIQVKMQKDAPNFKRFSLNLDIETLKAKDRTNLEVVNIPSYQHQTMIIRKEVLPVNPAINVETPQEILSDKFVALGARDYLKGRDIWDIYFILNTLKVSLNKDILQMVQKKIRDYQMHDKEFKLKFKENLLLLKEKGSQVLRQEMEKFLPVFYRRSFAKKYQDISEEVLAVSLEVLERLK